MQFRVGDSVRVTLAKENDMKPKLPLNSRWTVVGKAPKRSGRGDNYWRCNCICGSAGEVTTYQLQSGNSLSCGCLQKESVAIKHNKSGTRTYRIWANMVQRCTNPASRGYPNYGGRGIGFHSSWRDFSKFLADMGECPPGMLLERKNNNKSYCRTNCKWATRKEQNRNKRSNHRITFQGVTLTAAGWQEKTGISASAIIRRIRRGWTAEEALTLRSQRSR